MPHRIRQARFELGQELLDNSFMISVNVDDINQNLSAYLQRVKAGETLIIIQAGQAVAEIRPLLEAQPELRPFGLCAGEFSVPNDFDEPLPERILVEFES